MCLNSASICVLGYFLISFDDLSKVLFVSLLCMQLSTIKSVSPMYCLGVQLAGGITESGVCSTAILEVFSVSGLLQPRGGEGRL